MKKLILLALVALVAGALFAETAPAFSGSFDYYTNYDFTVKNFTTGSTQDAKIALNGVVDEWSTVSAEIGRGTAAVWADSDTTGTPGTVDAGEMSTDGSFMKLNTFTMTTDMTGALGVDGPVSLSVTWGYVYHEAAEYQGVAGFSDYYVLGKTNSYAGLKLDIGIMDKVKLITAIFPGTYLNSNWDINGATNTNKGAVYSFELQFLQLTEGLNFNVWYGNDANSGLNELGLTLGYSGITNVNLGAAVEYSLAGNDGQMGISAQYIFGDLLTAGLSFGARSFNDFASKAGLGVNATLHAVKDVLDFYAAASFPFGTDAGKYEVGIDAGLKYMLGAVSYNFGYAMNATKFASPVGEGLYFKVAAAF